MTHQRTGLPRPDVAAPSPWPFPLPLRHRLSNGVPVLLHHLPGQHVISTAIVFDHDLASEPQAYEGVTAMVVRTLTEGTRAHPGERFAELLENQGAVIGGDVQQAGTQVLMDVPATRLSAAVPLLAEVVREPDLSDTDVRRQVDLRLADLAQLRANSAATAGVEFRRRVLDSAARAGRPSGGEHASVASLTGELVRDRAAQLLLPGTATIVVGGDLGEPEDVLALLETSFGDWSGPATTTEHPTVGAGVPGCTIIDRPGSVQADLRLGGWGIDRDDPRWPALRVATYAIGGSFNSRINTVLREEKGYTYGARVGFTPMRTGGWWAAQGSFRTEVVGDAIATARHLLDTTAAPFTAEEVRDAQQYLTGAAPLQYATADGVVDQTALQLIMGLPDDYLDQSLAQVLTVTPDAATKAYGSIVDTSRLTCVVVGDAEALEPQVRAAGFDPTVVAAED